MDEISAKVKADPVAFRLQHLRDQRIMDVVKAAADAAKWEKRASPRKDVSLSHAGSSIGRGIACVAYEGNNGYSALVAEVEVDMANGKVQVRKFFVALDCGPISNPDGVRNQIEGGVLQGMSRALLEEVTWDETRVTSNDWETYNSFYLGAEMPAMEIVLINRTDVPATGAGETAITLVPAALGNAIFDATGARLREAPFTAARVKSAMAARNQQQG